MALSSSTVWEVRTTGSDSNGGGFVAGASGTDYSQQDTAQYSAADLVVDGTTNTKVTSASHSFVAADVGNLIHVTSGTGWTAGFYQIVSVASGAATLDRSPAAVSTTGGSYAVGGALLTIGQALTNATGSNNVYVKGGTYSISSTLPNFAAGGGSRTSSVVGYSSTRGDNGQPIIQASAAITMVSQSSSLSYWANLIFDGNNTASTCFIGGSEITLVNCVFKKFTSQGCRVNGNRSRVYSCVATAGTSAGSGGFYTGGDGVMFLGCVAVGNACIGFGNGGFGADYHFCIAANNTGATSHAFDGVGRSSVINCVAYGNGGNGVNGVGGFDGIYANNIFENNTGTAISGNSGAQVFADYNGFYNNGATYSSGLLNWTGGAHDVTATADVFTNAAGLDFSLNNNNPGGAQLRGKGWPGSFPGLSTIGFQDIGATQHQATGSGSGPVGFAFS